MRNAVARLPRTVLSNNRKNFHSSINLLNKDGGVREDDPPPSSTSTKTRQFELIKEQGYFHEMIELSRGKGKPFIASDALTVAADSPVFPFVSGDTLVNDNTLSLPACARGKITLVALSFKQFGFLQLGSWVEPFRSEIAVTADAARGTASPGSSSSRRRNRSSSGGSNNSSGSSNIQVVQISAMEGGFIANLLKGSVKSGLVTATPPELHATSIVAMGPIDPMCSDLKVDNRLLGHVYLLDEEARVRWRACGAATPEELESLKAAFQTLQLEK